MPLVSGQMGTRTQDYHSQLRALSLPITLPCGLGQGSTMFSHHQRGTSHETLHFTWAKEIWLSSGSVCH